MVGVPRVWERVKAGVFKKLASRTPIARWGVHMEPVSWIPTRASFFAAVHAVSYIIVMQ